MIHIIITRCCIQAVPYDNHTLMYTEIRALGTPTRSPVSTPTARTVSLSQMSVTCEVKHIRSKLLLEDNINQEKIS